jgi:hypothetical protein
VRGTPKIGIWVEKRFGKDDEGMERGMEGRGGSTSTFMLTYFKPCIRY